MPSRLPFRALLVAVAVVAAACGGSPVVAEGDPAPAPSDTDPAPAPSDDATVAPPEPVVAEVLRFEAPLLGGGTLRGETLAGRDVAFWFWAPW